MTDRQIRSQSVATTQRVRRIVGLAVGVTLLSAGAAAQITISSGTAFAAASGSSGRAGSSTGPLLDQPPNVTGNGGTLIAIAHIEGGPVLPQEPQSSFPGTTCEVEADSRSEITFAGGTNFMRITCHGTTTNALIAMDGPGLSAGAGANGSTDVTFTVTESIAYSLTGFAAFDDDDVSGSVRLFRGILPQHGVFNTANGLFSFSGMLSPGTYRLLCNSNVIANSNQPGVPNPGNFRESSYYDAVLSIGCVGILRQPESATACSDEDVSFSVLAASTGSLTYQWQVEDTPGNWVDVTDVDLPTVGAVSDGDSHTMTVSFLEPGGRATFRCLVTNPGCFTTSSTPVQLSVCNFASDVDCDGVVGLIDLATLLTHYGETGNSTIEEGDVDGDRDVDLTDLATLLTEFGTACE
ncbi:MAG: hypothetical protein ACKVS9_10530 [Phycisphaerae bacterium]